MTRKKRPVWTPEQTEELALLYEQFKQLEYKVFGIFVLLRDRGLIKEGGDLLPFIQQGEVWVETRDAREVARASGTTIARAWEAAVAPEEEAPA
jgi:hypothetical protein